MIDRDLIYSLINDRYHVESINQNKSGHFVINIIDNFKVFTYFILSKSYDQNNFVLMAKDFESLHKLSSVFRTDVLYGIKDDFINVGKEFKFINAFCFGSKVEHSFDFYSLVKNQQATNSESFIELSSQTEMLPLNYFKVKYTLFIDFSNGNIVKKAQYYNFTAAGEKRILVNNWDTFKIFFLDIYAANKLNISLGELKLQDSKVVPMLNI